MCNYFSIGLESRIGIGFDKNRTSNATCNKICYGWEGLKKMMYCCCCCIVSPTKKVKEVVQYVSTIEEGKEVVLFATDKSVESE